MCVVSILSYVKTDIACNLWKNLVYMQECMYHHMAQNNIFQMSVI